MIILVHGPDIFRSKQYIDQTINQIIAKNPTINLQKIDGSIISAEQLINTLQPLQLFSQKKILLLKNIFRNKQKKLSEILKKYLDQPDIDNSIIFWEQSAIDKRSSLYKKIKKISTNNEFPLLKKPQLISWVKQYCQSQKINIDMRSINALIDKNPNTYFLHNEIQKLKTYSDNHITYESIQKLTPSSPQEIIFDLTDQIGQKKQDLAYQTAIHLTQKGEDPFRILATLATHIENLIIIKELTDQRYRQTDIKDYTKLHPFVIEKCTRQITNFSTSELKHIYHLIARADINLKTSQSDFPQEIYQIIFYQYQKTDF